MTYDLSRLTRMPDLRDAPNAHARLVCAMREAHVARAARKCCRSALVRYFGTLDAVRAFHVLMDEAGRAWPDPIVFNPECQPLLSFDEKVLVDLVTAAAKNERDRFDAFSGEMIDHAGRNAIWYAARRLLRHLAPSLPT